MCAMAKGSNKLPGRTTASAVKNTPRVQGTSKEGQDTRGAKSVREGFGKAKVA